MPAREPKLLVYAVLLATCFGLYARSITFPFLRYDDTLLIVGNQAFLQDLGNIPRAFAQDAWNVPGHRSSESYYRPLYTLSFMLDAQMAGTNPAFYHLTNILLHGLATCLVFALLLQLGTALFPSAALALFFALHPAFVSVVAWVPGRNDSLLAVFVLAAVLFLERYARSGQRRNLIPHFGFLAASFFTKEAGLMFPLLGCVYLVTIGHKRLPSSQKQILLAGWILLAAVWAVFRFLAVSPGQLGPGLLANLADNWILAIHYLGKTLIPVQLALLPTLADTSLLPGLAVLLALGALAVLRSFGRPRQALFGMSWFLLFLLPTLVVPVLVGLEHRLYLALAGILIVVATLDFVATASATRGGVAVTTLLLLSAGALCWHRISDLRNRESFWEASVRASPHSSLALFNLGTVRLQAGQLNEAGKLLREALDINPGEPMANNNLGVLHIRRKRPLEALPYFEMEVQVNPDYADAYFNLGAAHWELGQRAQAVEHWEKTLEKNPSHTRALRFLADYYARTGELPRAAEYLQRLNPSPE